MAIGDGTDPFHVDGAAEQMHRDQGLGGRGNRRFRLIEIDQVAALLHIHKHRRRAHGADRFGRGKKAERCRDHLIARTNPQGPQRQDQGIGAAVAANRKRHAAGGCEVVLKPGNRGATDVLATAQDLQHGLIKSLSELMDLLAEAEGGHLHGGQLKPVAMPAIAGGCQLLVHPSALAR